MPRGVTTVQELGARGRTVSIDILSVEASCWAGSGTTYEDAREPGLDERQAFGEDGEGAHGVFGLARVWIYMLEVG